ncbi:sodium:proton antiporter NhaD [Engelhardtia mirabilis]|uniref:Na(+)/H(+) antiporter NhaD n=1 Tax=Engelhardtia mirabilis TaxID=2528011 RepID=A0A518BN37_9BACT|nr:Na(+)/H(+) antiporter NhaD [Planctomycetes bacterium Pla133]QDV02679.1 Na(+)/H(+) antiporter NhaD [Planctomycetes bacterium Pla86]
MNAILPALLGPLAALSEGAHHDTDLTGSAVGLAAVVVFVFAYLLVVAEDVIHLRKSKPVLIAAGVIWILTAIGMNDPETIAHRVEQHVAEFAELFLFLMVAMTYISAIAHRNVFFKLNALLVNAGFGLRAIFWTTGALAFMISPIADNLTTALLMGAVVTTVGRGNTRFISLACINVVIAANAGGAFSPFGDITTLMVWQAGHVPTLVFLDLVPAALVNWLVPAILMSLAVPAVRPQAVTEDVELKPGWLMVMLMFLATIATAVCFHAVLHLPPFLGMTTGLGYYMLWGYWTRLNARRYQMAEPVDVFDDVAKVEWDTLLFFFGVLMCVGGLSELGYLAVTSEALYTGHGPTNANIAVGLISAVVDNVPVMFAVLSMDPVMGATPAAEIHQWLLATLAAGVGGSLLSVGSAAGVALMGTTGGEYTFMRHLVWTPAILLGYAASIGVHQLLNMPAASVLAGGG